MINLAALRNARVAVVGLEVTTGRPPLIVELAVYHVDGGSITAGPWCFCVAPDAPLAEVRVSAWPKLRLAPPWVEVAELGRKTTAKSRPFGHACTCRP